jgi:Flp pilus assembly protein TadG
MDRLKRLLYRLGKDPGQAMVEYILLLPIIFLLIMNLVNFGTFTCAWIGVANAARAGADYAVLGGLASVGGARAGSGSVVDAVITADATTLPNVGSMTVVICQNNNNTVTPVYPTGGTCSNVASDPEPTNFVLTSVDVSYNYSPFITAFSFPKLGVYLTLPPTTIRRVTVMRAIQ